MLNVYFAFAGPTGNVLNYFGNSEAAIGGLTVTRTAAGQYTCVFLTKHKIEPDQQPIIQVSSSGPSGAAGIDNVISSNVVFVPTMSEFTTQVTLNIETYGGALDPDIMMVSYAV
ncbi:DUF807 family protein [Rickettsiella endosymbiont of Rhagonycha lignosa]|uniref:DUF807 family protein n=1 Tax=Rickettsiella endosymbiont of Rhagonycha lignosa TaxID=3077937 RepID=UPI00313BD7A3